jgi:integrase
MACKVHNARAKAQAKPTGTLTRKMHEELILFARKENPAAAACMTLHALVGGRISQVLRMRRGDFQPDDFGKCVIFMRTDKRRRRNGSKYKSKHSRKVVPKAAETFAERYAISKGIAHGKRLFPEFTVKSGSRKINEIIHRGAKQLNFPTGYRWNGSHILRHCGTAMLLQQAELLFKDIMTQMSRPTQKWYGNPLNARKPQK